LPGWQLSLAALLAETVPLKGVLGFSKGGLCSRSGAAWRRHSWDLGMEVFGGEQSKVRAVHVHVSNGSDKEVLQEAIVVEIDLVFSF